MVKRIEGGQLHTSRTLLAVKTVLEMTGAKRILEIGFNTGDSAKAFLDAGAEYVHSVDIGEHPYIEECGNQLKTIYDDQFDLTIKNSRDLTTDDIKDYDLIFIDGDHNRPEPDLQLAARANIPWILFDDCHPKDRWWPQLFPLINMYVDQKGSFPYRRFAMFYYDALGGDDAIEETAMMLVKRSAK